MKKAEKLDTSNALGWQQANVIGVYLHDLLKNTAYRQTWLQSIGWQGQSVDWEAIMDAELDHVAAQIEATGWFKDKNLG